MSKLDKLLRELCPEGVEYKTLGEIGKFYGGLTGKSKKDFEDGNEVFITYKNVYSNPALDIYPNDKVKIADGEKQRTLEYGDIVFTGSSETPDECGFSSVVTREPDRKLYLNSFCFFFRLDNPKVLLPDFSKHLFRSSELRFQIGKTASGVTRYNVSKDKMAKVEIPLPPLGIQCEIVRILDNFTNLTAELVKELTARKTQYGYYRNKFLDFESSVSVKTIGDICDVVVGGEPPTDCIKGDVRDSTHIYPVWGNGKEVYGYSGTYKIDRDAVVISSIGANTGAVYYKEAFFTPIIRLKVILPKDNRINARFLFHALSGTTIKSKSSSVPNMNANEIKAIKIPVPPLDVQNRIVNVLDNFEKICSDLNIGLPAEIEARQKQYEYYRDKLLTFAETGNTILSRAEQSRAEQSRAEQSRAEQSRAEQSRALIKLLQYVFGYVRISLGDIGSICMCKRILKSQTNTVSGVPFYKIGTFGKKADAYISQETFNEYRSRYNFPKKGDVLISAAGTIGRTVVYDGKPAYFQDSNIVWIDNDESIVLNSYLRYCYELKPWKASEGGTIPRLYNDNIAKAVIAVPSIEEQKRIVSILDRFDAICNDLTSGLPAEIEARQKQYEYYRDKLLNFRKYKDESSN